ncbi:hypothetical protein [Campylobacter porcelli]|nr:hypothetical protein [Campylobacter sp. P0078]
MGRVVRVACWLSGGVKFVCVGLCVVVGLCMVIAVRLAWRLSDWF